MAYTQTYIIIPGGKDIPVFIGETEDTCHLCGRSLNGKDCLKIEEDNILMCIEQNECTQSSVEGVIG